jgi:ribonuclease III
MNPPPTPTPLEETIGYTFADPGLLDTALTHRSYANEQRGQQVEDNERLEFLGDAVLDFYVSEQLVRRLPDWTEGDLSQGRAALVNEGALATLARRLGLGQLLRLGRGEDRSGGRDKDSLLCDVLEALIGALLLDGGIRACEQVLEGLLGEAIGALRQRIRMESDPKTALQEWLAARGESPPRYQVLGEIGPPHAHTFTVGVTVGGQIAAVGSGPSKKIAERRAAQAAHIARRRTEALR